MKRTKGWRTRQAQVALGTIPVTANVVLENGRICIRGWGHHITRGKGIYWMLESWNFVHQPATSQKTIDYEYVLRGRVR